MQIPEHQSYWEASEKDLSFLPQTLKHKEIGNMFFDKATQLQYLITSFLTKKHWLKLFAISKATVKPINFLRTTVPENNEGLKRINNLFLEEKMEVSPWKQANASTQKYRNSILKNYSFSEEIWKTFENSKVLPERIIANLNLRKTKWQSLGKWAVTFSSALIKKIRSENTSKKILKFSIVERHFGSKNNELCELLQWKLLLTMLRLNQMLLTRPSLLF